MDIFFTYHVKNANNSSQTSPVRYAKFQLIQYLIDFNIFQNSLIDIDIDIFKKVHIDIDIFKNDHVDIYINIDIFQIVLIDIDTDIDIFQISLSIFLSISIFSKFSYRYFFDIDILKISVDISSIFQKKPIYRQSISIFHQKSMKNSNFCWKKWIFYPKCPYRYRYRYRYFSALSYRYWYIDIDIFQKCRYIDNRYVISIYRTGLPRVSLESSSSSAWFRI